MTSRNVHGVDLVRFLAALMVMWFHLSFWSWWAEGRNQGTIQRHFPNLPDYTSLITLSWFGWVGVQIFFVISGYVIMMSASKRNAADFLRSRALRIYPTAWICTIIIAGISVQYSSEEMSLQVLRFLNSLIISPHPRWVDGVYWTLIVEIMFYALVFFMIYLFDADKASVAINLIGLASCVFLILNLLDLSVFTWPATLILLQHGVFFSVGNLLYELITKGRHTGLNISMLSIFLLGCCTEIYLTAVRKLQSFNLEGEPIVPVLVWTAFLAVLIGSIVFSQKIEELLNDRAKAVIRNLGLMTYPLYLIHSLVGGLVLYQLSTHGFDPIMSLVSALTVSVATALAVVGFERRILIIFKKFNPSNQVS